MQRKLGLILATALLMFPQIVETIYSPALTQIAKGFHVTPEQAAQTLSLYFFAFAVGVVFWGRLCDQMGRRARMVGGLLIYALASLIALFSTWFGLLLFARMLAAFGAAVGSVVTQTMMRDIYQGKELARVFSLIGIGLAASLAIGMVTGAVLTNLEGYRGVFSGLFILAILLVTWSLFSLPETRPIHVKTFPLMPTLGMMLRDVAIWRTAFLVTLFNVYLFSYYQLAPFDFERLGLSSQMFGSSGILLALGVALGSWLNKQLLHHGWSSDRAVLLASIVALIAGIMVMLLLNTGWFVLPMVLVVMAYGIAIPNILASALTKYTDRVGTGGALLGLLYYLMLGAGLALAGWSQHLGLVLICSSALAVPLAFYASSKEKLV